MSARQRFDEWCTWTGLNQEELAALLEVHQTTVSRVRSGARVVGVPMAVAIERRMREWKKDGVPFKKRPVTPEDWAAEMRRTGTDGS